MDMVLLVVSIICGSHGKFVPSLLLAMICILLVLLKSS
jgi:hypothetical protein